MSRSKSKLRQSQFGSSKTKYWNSASPKTNCPAPEPDQNQKFQLADGSASAPGW